MNQACWLTSWLTISLCSVFLMSLATLGCIQMPGPEHILQEYI